MPRQLSRNRQPVWQNGRNRQKSILYLLQRHPAGIQTPQIFRYLNIYTPAERTRVRKTLNTMLQQGVITRTYLTPRCVIYFSKGGAA